MTTIKLSDVLKKIDFRKLEDNIYKRLYNIKTMEDILDKHPILMFDLPYNSADYIEYCYNTEDKEIKYFIIHDYDNQIKFYRNEVCVYFPLKFLDDFISDVIEVSLKRNKMYTALGSNFDDFKRCIYEETKVEKYLI